MSHPGGCRSPTEWTSTPTLPAFHLIMPQDSSGLKKRPTVRNLLPFEGFLVLVQLDSLGMTGKFCVEQFVFLGSSIFVFYL